MKTHNEITQEIQDIIDAWTKEDMITYIFDRMYDEITIREHQQERYQDDSKNHSVR